MLCEAGTIVPAIDRRYPLREVPEALRYLGEGHAKGKVVITLCARLMRDVRDTGNNVTWQ
jgi:D-arabinose 1-dehydrogenase-like Zn-dependent alcohol dehydrogenase